jgi:hypothetical protein
MALTQAIAVGGVQLFKLRLLGRMQALARETGESSFALPVALFLLADEESGGGVSGPRLAQRFGLTDFESRNVVDAFFPGWSALPGFSGSAAASGLARQPPPSSPSSPRKPGSPATPASRRVGMLAHMSPPFAAAAAAAVAPPSPAPVAQGGASLNFDVRSIDGFRQALSAAGVKPLAGKADLVLVDSCYLRGVVNLSFSSAVHVDLTAAANEGRLVSLDGVLQTWNDVLTEMRAQASRPGGAPSWRWSTDLGVAVSVSRQSLLDSLVDAWDPVRGAGWITRRATRGLGPDLPLIQL